MKSISLETKNREEAIQLVAEAKILEIERAANIGILSREVVSKIISGKRFTTSDAMEKWREYVVSTRASSTASNYLWYVAAWARSAGLMGKPLNHATEADVDKWINREGKFKAGSRRFMLAVLRAFFKFCTARAYCFGDPSALITVRMSRMNHGQKEKKVRRVFTEEEISNLVAAAAGTPWHPIIVIARETGLRLGDVCQLEWASLNTPGKISVWTAKRDKRVELPITPAMQSVLGLINYEDERYCFPEHAALRADPRKRAMLSTYFIKLCKTVGIRTKTFHDLRSTYCSAEAAAGVKVEKIAAAVGHSSPALTESVYIKPHLEPTS